MPCPLLTEHQSRNCAGGCNDASSEDPDERPDELGGVGFSSQPSGKGVPGGMPHHPTMVQRGSGMPNHANAAPGKPGSSAHPNQNVLEAVKKVFFFIYFYSAHQGYNFPPIQHNLTRKSPSPIDCLRRCRRRLRTNR